MLHEQTTVLMAAVKTASCSAVSAAEIAVSMTVGGDVFAPLAGNAHHHVINRSNRWAAAQD